MIRIFLADDHALLTESLQFMLQQDGGLEIVGSATDGHETVSRCIELRPDIVLMDIKMPGMNGMDAAALIKKACPEMKIVILTTFEDRQNMMGAIEKGIDGYLLKDLRPEALVLAVRCINHGLMVMHGAMKSFFQGIAAMGAANILPADQELKAEDIKIIRLIGDGKNNKEIAELLNYSEGTIRNRISRLMEKFSVGDRTQLVVYALKNDLI